MMDFTLGHDGLLYLLDIPGEVGRSSEESWPLEVSSPLAAVTVETEEI